MIALILAGLLLINNPGIYDFMGSGYVEDDMVIPVTRTITNKDMTYIISDEEYDLLCQVVNAEARGEDPYTQEAVAAVVLNRWMKDPEKDLKDIINAPHQFAKLKNYDIEIEVNVNDAIRYWNKGAEATLPVDVIYFRSGHFHTWAKDYKQMGNLYFSR